MQSTPKTIASDLITRINEAKEKGMLHENVITGFEDEAYKLRSADVGEGDMILGILAAHRGDLREVRKRFKNALAYLGDVASHDHNYGIALFLCGDYSGAIQVLTPYIEFDYDAAMTVGKACMLLGLKAKAKSIFSSLEINVEDIDKKLMDAEIKREENETYRKDFIKSAISSVKKSFLEDKEIWQSLSRR